MEPPVTVNPSSQISNEGSVLETLIFITKCLKELAECAPITGLKSVAGIALLILETAQGIAANRNDCILLAERIGRIVLSVKGAVQKLGGSSAQTNLDAKLDAFSRLLQTVREFVVNQSKAKWIRRIISQKDVKAAIAGYHQDLNDICVMFEIGTLIDIYQLLSELVPQRALGPVQDQPANPDPQGLKMDVVGIPACQMDLNFRLFSRSDILLRRCLSRSTKKSAELFEGEIDGRAVVVKRFRGAQSDAETEFTLQRELWRKLWHPNLSQLIGYSKHHDPPFIVLSAAGTKNVFMFMNATLRQDPIGGQVVALRLIRDIVTAMLHIEEQTTLTNISPDFLDSSNLSLNEFGEVVVRDLSFEADQSTSVQDHTRVLLFRYRKICREVLYGKDMFLHFYPPSRLEAPGTHPNASYMGSLLNTIYSMDKGPAAALDKITNVLEILPAFENAMADPRLMMGFHMTLLERGFTLNKFSHSFHADLDKQQDLRLGDIGHLCGSVHDPSFVTLCNVHELLGPVIDESNHSNSDSEGTSSTGGVHCFWRNQCYEGVAQAWQFMLSNVCSIAKKYNVFPDQLILITGITERPLSRCISDKQPSVQTRLDDSDAAQFFEYVRTYASMHTPEDEVPYEIARKHLRMQQRLEWVHLGKYQCVEQVESE